MNYGLGPTWEVYKDALAFPGQVLFADLNSDFINSP